MGIHPPDWLLLKQPTWGECHEHSMAGLSRSSPAFSSARCTASIASPSSRPISPMARHANSNASSTTCSAFDGVSFIKTLAPQWSDFLVQHAQQAAAKAGRTYLYRTGSFLKDQWAEGLLLRANASKADWSASFLHPRNLQLVRSGACSGAASIRLQATAATCSLLVLSTRPRTRPHPRAAPDLGAVHVAGLRQWSRLARPATRSRLKIGFVL